jgi:5-methylcytosine-specific restriction enzyme subunit McrC
MAKQQTMLRGFAVCDVDELTSDVLHNRILRSTLLSLSNCHDVAADLRHELRISAKLMTNVTPIHMTAMLFARTHLSRNTSQYLFLMRVCELVFHALLPDETGSGSKFQSLLDDEIRMSSLFEDFLRNFYRSELMGYSANAEIMPWMAETQDDMARALLPVMKTDITLRSSQRTIIADAKYYKEVFAKGQYATRLRSGHLYQLMTYLSHVKVRKPATSLSGILIYPTNGTDLLLRYSLLGIPVIVATVDLNSPWQDIHRRLIDIVLRSENHLQNAGVDDVLASTTVSGGGRPQGIS